MTAPLDPKQLLSLLADHDDASVPAAYDTMAAQEESYVPESAPARAPALAPTEPFKTNETQTKLKTMISGTVPSPGAPAPAEDGESRLERLMNELKTQRDSAANEAASRQFKANIVKGLTDNIGNIVGGAQAMNTKASVTPVQVKGYDVGDLVGQVDKRYAGDREALLEQYKNLMNAKDKGEQRKYQQEQLGIQREGNRIKEKLGHAKIDAKSGGLELTPGEEATDKAFAKDYNLLTSKGFNNAEVSIKKLDDLADKLDKEGDGVLAAGGGRTSILPDSFRDRDSINWRDSAQNEAFSTLKDLFPGSISDGERKAAAQGYYNDQLKNSENAKIIRTKSAQLKQSLLDQKSKAEHFSKVGTLKGHGLSTERKPAENTISDVGGTVERLDKASGKVAIFDAKTKQFIKFKD